MSLLTCCEDALNGRIRLLNGTTKAIKGHHAILLNK